MSDRIAVMSQGKVLQVGTPTEIYERPTCRFVADFIGETNFVEGTVAATEGPVGSDVCVALTTGEGLTVRGVSPRPIAAGARAMLSIRPEKARLTLAEAPAGAATAFAVQVERVAYIGSDTRIQVRLGAQEFDIWEQNTRSTLDREAYWQPGEKGHLWWPAENALMLTE